MTTSVQTRLAAPARVRPRWFFHFNAKEGFVAGVVTATVQFVEAYRYGIAEESDFGIFQATTTRFLDGLPMYSGQAIDFTPPPFHLLLVPLAHIDPRIAFLLWTATNVLVSWFVLMVILRAVPGAMEKRWVIAAWVANGAGVQMTIRLGQVSWLVALVVVCAWLAARSSRWVATGIWSGIAILFKPFLLVLLPVFVVRRRWKALGVSVLSAAACFCVGVLVFGVQPSADWIHNLRAIPDPGYLTHFLNASWLGVIARARAPYAVGTFLSAATILVMLWRVRSSDEDTAWLLLLIAAVLASPVGWIYYQPILIGPGLALAVAGRFPHLRWIAVTCIVPGLSSRLFQGSPAIALTLGSIYFWGLFVAFAGLCLPSNSTSTKSLSSVSVDCAR